MANAYVISICISIPCSNIFCVNYMSSSVGSVLSSLCMCVLRWAWALLQFYPFYQFSNFANVSNTCFLLKTMSCIQYICISVKPNCLWWDNLRARVNDLDPFRSLKQITHSKWAMQFWVTELKWMNYIDNDVYIHRVDGVSAWYLNVILCFYGTIFAARIQVCPGLNSTHKHSMCMEG